MSSALKFVPPRVQFVDPRTGMITREWYLFLLGVFNRVGGSIGESTTDLSASAFDDAGTEETEAMLYAISDAWQQQPHTPPAMADDQALLQPIAEPMLADDLSAFEPRAAAMPDDPDLLADLAALRAEVDTLRQAVQSLLQGTTI